MIFSLVFVALALLLTTFVTMTGWFLVAGLLPRVVFPFLMTVLLDRHFRTDKFSNGIGTFLTFDVRILLTPLIIRFFAFVAVILTLAMV